MAAKHSGKCYKWSEFRSKNYDSVQNVIDLTLGWIDLLLGYNKMQQHRPRSNMQNETRRNMKDHKMKEIP